MQIHKPSIRTPLQSINASLMPGQDRFQFQTLHELRSTVHAIPHNRLHIEVATVAQQLDGVQGRIAQQLFLLHRNAIM